MSSPTLTDPLNRRELLARLGKTLLATPLLNAALLNVTLIGASCGEPVSKTSSPPPPALSDDQFLDEIERAAFLYFWEQAGSATGQVKDRAFAAGNDTRTISSIAATGFGLAALCIADQRGYMASASVIARVQVALSFLLQMPNENGFFYHFVDMNTGQRAGNSEVSSIDSTILMCGILTCRQHFQDQQIVNMATQLY